MERVSFHANSTDFYKELIHSFCASTVVDATPLSENMAMAAIMMRRPCTCIAYTEFHAISLKERLTKRVFQALTNERVEELYEPVAVSDLCASKDDEAAMKDPVIAIMDPTPWAPLPKELRMLTGVRRP